MADLCTTADVEARIGRELTAAEETRVAALIDDASAAIRLYTGRPFAATTTTVRRKPHFGVVRLRQRGITAVTSVTNLDGDAVDFEWDGLSQVVVGASTYRFDLDSTIPTAVDVTFTHGSNTIPDAIKAVCAQMAARAFGRPADTSGIQQEAIAGYSYTVGVAAASGAVGLLPDEKAVLDRYRSVGGTAWVAGR